MQMIDVTCPYCSTTYNVAVSDTAKGKPDNRVPRLRWANRQVGRTKTPRSPLDILGGRGRFARPDRAPADRL